MSVRNSTNYPSSPVTNVLYPTPFDLTEECENSSDLSPNESYAATTYLRIDDQAAGRLDDLKMEVRACKIMAWVGGHPVYLRKQGTKISIRDARLLNQNSGRSIFEINENHLLEFKIINSARAILDSLSEKHSFPSVSRSLNFTPCYLQQITDGKLSAISKVNAEKINEFFETDVFCIQQIFKRACTENIEEVRKEQTIDNCAQITLIKYDKRGREKFNQLDPSVRTKIADMIGTVIYNQKKSTSVANAVLVNKISGTDIYQFSVQNLEAVPYSKETRDRFKTLLNEKSAYFTLKNIVKESGIASNSLRSLEKGKQRRVPCDTAVKINDYFEERLFDFEKILNEALLEADHFYKASLETTKKRKIEEEEIRQSKKQKTAPNPASFDLAQPPLNEQQEWMTSCDEAIQVIHEKCWGPTPSQSLTPSSPECSVPLSPYSMTNPEPANPLYPELNFFFSSII